MIMDQKREAFAIYLTDKKRWFYKFGKGGRVMSAPYLAGAELYTRNTLKADEEKLTKKGVNFKVKMIAVCV